LLSVATTERSLSGSKLRTALLHNIVMYSAHYTDCPCRL
jgi:hypothetical protein